MADYREESDESDRDRDDRSNHSGDSGDSARATMQMCPLDLRFSQKKMRNVFADGKLIDESAASAVRAVRRSKEDADLYDAPWKLEADFPAIEVIKWRCKLRDDTTGRPIIDPATGREQFDDEDRWFTLDNRRLYCLQRAAMKLLPERSTADVIAEVQRDRRLREIRKFRTLDSGKSILIGSRVDGVPFSRWNWRSEYENNRQAIGGKAEEAGGKGGKAVKKNGKGMEGGSERANGHVQDDREGKSHQKGGKRGGKGHDKGSSYDNGYSWDQSWYGDGWDAWQDNTWQNTAWYADGWYGGGWDGGKGQSSGKAVEGGKSGGKWSDANGRKGGGGGKPGSQEANAAKDLLALLHGGGAAAAATKGDQQKGSYGKKGRSRGEKGSNNYGAGGVS